MPRASSPTSDGLTDTWGRRNRKLLDRKCQACGKSFRPLRSSSNYCSRPCARTKNGGQNKKPETWWTNQKGYIEGRIWEGDKQRRVKKHRLIAEKKLGRRLCSDEDVHHDNDVKNDNDPSNLIVMPHGEHAALSNKRRRAKATEPRP